jgi:putative membrane protein
MTMGYGYGPGWGMMGGWGYGGYGWGYGLLHVAVSVAVIVCVVFVVIWALRAITGVGPRGLHMHRSSGLDVLEERYARGEINRDEYLQKKKDIGG